MSSISMQQNPSRTPRETRQERQMFGLTSTHYNLIDTLVGFA